jgi:hypothetical protein
MARIKYFDQNTKQWAYADSQYVVSDGNTGSGDSGFSPIASVEQTDTGAVISITDKNGTTTATITHGENGDPGKSAYEYAQDGGYTGTEEEFAEKLAQGPLVGFSSEIKPSQVYEAIVASRDVVILHDHETFGLFGFTSFDVNISLKVMFSSSILQYNGMYVVVELIGYLDTDKWEFVVQQIPIMSDIPTRVSQLENDERFATENKLPKAFCVTVLDNGDGTGEADKTFEEILAAYENGSAILGRIDTAGQTCVILNLMTYEMDFNAFGVTGIASDGLYWAAMVTKDEGTLVGNLPLVQSPVIGTTAEITPSQVKALMDEGKSFAITHTDSTYGSMLFNSFVMSQAANNSILSTTVFQTGGVTFCAQLIGSLNTDKWSFSAFTLATTEDIPTIPESLKNPYALTINGAAYDGSKAIDFTDTINEMIDVKLSSITNAEEVAF